MAHAKCTIEEWRIEYKTERPHSSLGNLTPEQFAENCLGRESWTKVSAERPGWRLQVRTAPPKQTRTWRTRAALLGCFTEGRSCLLHGICISAKQKSGCRLGVVGLNRPITGLACPATACLALLVCSQ